MILAMSTIGLFSLIEVMKRKIKKRWLYVIKSL
jgi:hypothetical protein